ncbi:MAG TPA: hypothetical protein PLA77_09790, partial [Bacteroidales bacterium]|nr:hypothetical protein [Bacteroidales bacterium]
MKKIKDGIVDLEKYNQAKYKILWILKEGNVDENDKEIERDICDEFRNNKHKENACAIPTFRKVIYASFGILYPEISWREIPSANSDGYEIIKEIAYINLNKYPGGNFSNKNTIE